MELVTSSQFKEIDVGNYDELSILWTEIHCILPWKLFIETSNFHVVSYKKALCIDVTWVVATIIVPLVRCLRSLLPDTYMYLQISSSHFSFPLSLLLPSSLFLSFYLSSSSPLLPLSHPVQKMSDPPTPKLKAVSTSIPPGLLPSLSLVSSILPSLSPSL